LPRRRKVIKREMPPDKKFNSLLATRFINNLMKKGKKSLAEGVFYQAIEIVERKTGQPGMDLFEKAINNVKPMLEVKSRRVGGATYQVPVEVRPNRRTALAIRWLILYGKERAGKSMAEKLASEFMAASKNEGGAIKKRDDTHRMAEANKAFAHFRW